MFFKDGLVVPAPGPVEFCNQRGAVVDPDLVDPVLVTVENQQMAVTDMALAFDRRKNGIRIKVLVGKIIG